MKRRSDSYAKVQPRDGGPFTASCGICKSTENDRVLLQLDKRIPAATLEHMKIGGLIIQGRVHKSVKVCKECFAIYSDQG